MANELILEKVMDHLLELHIVKERYGDGFACFLAQDETCEEISDYVTGADHFYELTVILEQTWYPYVTAPDINQAIQRLSEKVAVGVGILGVRDYATICTVVSGNILSKRLNTVSNWKPDLVDFYNEWVNGSSLI